MEKSEMRWYRGARRPHEDAGVFYFTGGTMDTKQAVKSQYLAALAMLKQAIERCPDALWNVADEKNKFWQVAYHTLFYVHLYLQKTIADFKPWAKHREGTERLEKAGVAYTRDEILEYLTFCQAQVVEQTAALELEAPSGFEWLQFNKLELQFYNIRHVQQHVGELYERLGAKAAIDLDWVGIYRD
jgi:DinB superfamily